MPEQASAIEVRVRSQGYGTAVCRSGVWALLPKVWPCGSALICNRQFTEF